MNEVYWRILELLLIGFIFEFLVGWFLGIKSKEKGLHRKIKRD